MPTKTWTGATDGVWATAGNWSPSGAPSANDDVIFAAATTGLTTGPGAITLTSFTVQAAFDKTIANTTTDNITIAAGGTLDYDSTGASGTTFWGGDSSNANNATIYGLGTQIRVIGGGMGTGSRWKGNTTMEGTITLGSGAILEGTFSMKGAGCVMGANSIWRDTAGATRGTINAGASVYGKNTWTTSAGNLTLSTGTVTVYGDLAITQSGGNSVTWNDQTIVLAHPTAILRVNGNQTYSTALKLRGSFYGTGAGIGVRA